MGEKRAIAGPRRAPGDLRRDDGRKGTLDLQALFSKQLTIHGSYMGTKGELLRAAQFFFEGS